MRRARSRRAGESVHWWTFVAFLFREWDSRPVLRAGLHAGAAPPEAREHRRGVAFARASPTLARVSLERQRCHVGSKKRCLVNARAEREQRTSAIQNHRLAPIRGRNRLRSDRSLRAAPSPTKHLLRDPPGG